MVRYAQTSEGDAIERAIAVLGNRVKTSIIRYLRLNPNSSTKAIVDGIGVQRSSVALRLGELEEEDLVLADPPKSTRQRGEWPVYRVNDLKVTELYLRLGQEIAEI